MLFQIIFSLLALNAITYLQAETQLPSQLYNSERKDRQTKEIVEPSIIIVNYTLQDTLEKSHNAFKKNRVSAHYMIDQNGAIYETLHDEPKEITLINPEYLKARAWHAGHSYWKTDKQEINDCNSHSIGILFVTQATNNKIHPNVYTTPQHQTTEPTIWYDYTQEQIMAFTHLAQQLRQYYKIDNKDIVGHNEVAIDPTTKSLTRKVGPGPKFPWQQAAQQGVGLYHNLSEENINTSCNAQVKELQEMLKAWGYSVQITNTEDTQTRQAVIQAQIHHDQHHIDGDIKSCRIYNIMKALLAQHYIEKNNPA